MLSGSFRLEQPDGIWAGSSLSGFGVTILRMPTLEQDNGRVRCRLTNPLLDCSIATPITGHWPIPS